MEGDEDLEEGGASMDLLAAGVRGGGPSLSEGEEIENRCA